MWTTQCGVTPSIRERHGLQAALDYLISEKLLTFAEAATSHPEFAQELPVFVAEIRRMFTPEEIRTHLSIWVPQAERAAHANAEPGQGDFEAISPQQLDAQLSRLSVLAHLLQADHLGIS